ncbi:S-type anion channel slah3 [Ancistrocladus abbreviatus]
MDSGEYPGHMKQDHESLPSLVEHLPSHQETGFDTSEENKSFNNQLQPNDYQVFNKGTEMRAGHSWNDASHRKGSHSRVHSVSISMPPSPMGHHMTSNTGVIFSAHSQRLYMKDISNASPASEPWGARHARFYSQQIPKGITYPEATHSLRFPNYHVPPSTNPGDSQFKDRRFDSFKTLSAMVERQLLRSLGKPVEPEQEPENVQHTEIEAMPVDRYFDALEGPELDTLRPTEELVLPEDRLWPFLLRYPISTFGICLGTSCRAVLWKTLATSLSTNFLHVSLTVNFVLWCIAIALVALVAFTYCLKVIIYFEAVRREYHHPVRVNFFFAPWIALLFLALGVPPSVAQNLPHALWYVLMTPIFCLELKIYGQWMSGGQRRLSKVANPSNHVRIVGDFVGALLGTSMWLKEGPLFFFAVGLAHYIVLFVTLYQRLPTNETLPNELHPVFFLFVAAPSAASLAWANIQGSFDYGSRIVYFIALFLYFSLAVRVNFFRGFRFSVAWWAYTSPMTGAAIATIKYANEVTNVVTQTLAVILSGVSTLIVSIVLVSTIIHAFVLRDLFPNDSAIAISNAPPQAQRRWFNLRNDSSNAKQIENYLKFAALVGREKESSVKSDGKDLEASVGVPSIHGSTNGSMNGSMGRDV